MWNVAKGGSTIKVETVVGVFEFDAQRGGQITSFAVKDQKTSRPLLPAGQVMPGLVLTLADGTLWRLAEARAAFDITRQDSDSLAFTAMSKLGNGALEVELQYEVFADGAIFCNFVLEFAAGKSVTVRQVALETQLDVRKTRNARWNYVQRWPWVKQDATTVHAYNDSARHLPMSQRVEMDEVLLDVSLDLGWDNTRFFSNRLEFVLEDWSPFGSADMYKDTHTSAFQKDGLFNLRWDFCTQGTQSVSGGYSFRNRWGLLFAGSRYLSGQGDHERRNNALGGRICHCIYPYVRLKPEWPWCTMPIKQVKAQPPMVFKGNPGLERADEAFALGANTMILHQFWMRNPGSNNEPPADYVAEDPKWLKAYVDHCHDLGMKVLLYGRSTEMWQLYTPFFEDYCRQNYDGLYLDWSSPFPYGYCKGSLVHTSCYAFYTFNRALRKRVGDGGILIGHTGTHTQLACNLYDAEVSGEFSVLHEVLLGDPEACACYGIHGGVGGNLLGGGVKDRGIFMSDRAVSFCSALAMSSHVIMNPNSPYEQDSAYIKPLWDVQRKLPGWVTRVHNPTEQPIDGLDCDNESLFPIVYLNERGQGLMVVTNLGKGPVSGQVKLDLASLGITAGKTVKPLSFNRVHDCAADGAGVSLKNIPAEKFAAALIG